MFPYWLLFAYFAGGALLTASSRRAGGRVSLVLVAGMVMVALVIGLRYEVGADWPSYKVLFSYAGYMPLGRMLAIGDPAYQLLNWVVRYIGAGIWLVNLVCAVIFCWGLLRFAQAQPNPWLAVLVAVPYLVIVVAMGYTRQAVAIGVLMAGLAAVQRGASMLRFVIYVAVAALFHKTAVVALPLVVFSSERSKLVNVLVGALAVYVFYSWFLADSVGTLVRDYIKSEYSSQGAAIRVAMNLVPAAVFLLYNRRFGFPVRERRIWFFHSIAAFGLLALLLVLPSSTVVDRLALYVMPLQVAILSSVPSVMGTRQGSLLVVAYSFAIEFVWLNFATHAKFWVPYHFYPLA